MATKTTEQRDAYHIIYDILQYYGLGSLSDWLWKQITGDVPESEIFIKLRQTDAYKQRFPGMFARQKAGLRAMSEDEYIRNEQAYRQILVQNGVNPKTLDDPKDYLDFFTKDISVEEVGERASLWRILTKAPQTTARMKSLFNQYAGLKNLSDQDLFNILVENDSPQLKQLHVGMKGKTTKDLSVAGLKEFFQQALSQEEATFRGGGGFIAEQQGIRGGMVGGSGEFT